MNYNANKLPLNKLVAIDMDIKSLTSDELVYVPAPYFIRDDGMLCVDCETGIFVADYYNEFGLEFAPSIAEWAKDNGGYWEWVNPGCIAFVKN